MSKGGEPRAKTVGKCVSCGLVVREGDEKYTFDESLFHQDCAEANAREIARWNADVRNDKEVKSHEVGAVREADEAARTMEEGEGKASTR